MKNEDKLTFVISLGGSFLFSNFDGLAQLKKIVNSRRDKFVIIVGGGKLARDYINFGKSIGISDTTELHNIGIKSTQLNAYVISKYLNGNFFEGNPKNIKLDNGVRVLVSGGYKPGWTTDVGSAYAAISIGAKVLFNISKERGVYDSDPKMNQRAKFIKKLNFRRLYELTNTKRYPGMDYIFDPKAAKICEKNMIKVVVTKDVDDIINYPKISGSIIE